MQITIPQKMSNTGTIYDITSDNYDITINMGTMYNYAVVTPSFYNIDPTRHRTLSAAIRQQRTLSNMGYQGITILNRDGEEDESDIGYPPR